MTGDKPKSYMAAMKHYFGFKPGQTLKAFSEELKALSDADRNYFINGLRANGYPIEDTAAAAA